MTPQQYIHRIFIAGTVALVLVGIVSAIAAKPLTRHGVRVINLSQPQIDIPLTDFSLQDSFEKSFSRSDMLGRIWIVDFIFTSCAGPCPLMTQNMKRLQDEFADQSNLHFLTISVAPDIDTPQVLRDYAQRYGADSTRWRLVRGSMKSIYDLAIDGFKVAIAQARENQQIIHDTRFILLDARGHIRGYYDSTSVDQLQQLRRDAQQLLQDADNP